MTTELHEIDSAIKSCTSNRMTGRIIYSKEFLLSIRKKVASRPRSDFDNEALRYIFKNSYRPYVDPRKKSRTFRETHQWSQNTPQISRPKEISSSSMDLSKEQHDCNELPEWYLNGPSDFTDEYQLNQGDSEKSRNQEVETIADDSDQSSEFNRMMPKNPKPIFSKKEIAVPVVRTLRDIESKLDLKSSVLPKAKVDTSAYYTLLGIVNDALKRNSDKKSCDIHELRPTETTPNSNQNFNSNFNMDHTQSAINWINRMRDASSSGRKSGIQDMFKFQDSSLSRNQNPMFQTSQYFNRYTHARQQYLALLAMQQAANLNPFHQGSNNYFRQYVTAIAAYRQQALLSAMHPGAPPMRGMPCDSSMYGPMSGQQHKMGIDDLLHPQFEQNQEHILTDQLNNINKYGNFKREQTRHKPLVIVTPKNNASHSVNQGKLNKSPLFKADDQSVSLGAEKTLCDSY